MYPEEIESTYKVIKGNIHVYILPSGKLHRFGAAACWNESGTQFWYQYGKVHRDDGPAVIKADGTKEYWLNDTELKEGSLALKLVKERERRKEASVGTAD